MHSNMWQWRDVSWEEGRVGLREWKYSSMKSILRERAVEQYNSVSCGLDQQIAGIKECGVSVRPRCKDTVSPFPETFHSYLYVSWSTKSGDWIVWNVTHCQNHLEWRLFDGEVGCQICFKLLLSKNDCPTSVLVLSQMRKFWNRTYTSVVSIAVFCFSVLVSHPRQVCYSWTIHMSNFLSIFLSM